MKLINIGAATSIVALLLWLFLRSASPIPQARPIVARQPTLEEVRTAAVVKAALRWKVDPALALRVSRQENFSGLPGAWSGTGCCIGIMQVHLRTWYGRFHAECGGSDLIDQYQNACYGVLILKDALAQCRGVEPCALRIYFLGPGGRRPSKAGDAYVRMVMGKPADPF